MISPDPIGYHLATSISRTVDGMMFVAVAALLHLTGALLPKRSDTPPSTAVDRELHQAPREPSVALAPPGSKHLLQP